MSYFNDSKTNELKKKSNFFLVISVMLLASNFMLAGLCWYTSMHQKIEVTPFFGGHSYSKSDSEVDGQYLSQLTENFINTRLNVTPNNILGNHRRLLTYVDSSVYHTFNEQLLKERKQVKSQKISSYFDIKVIEPSPSKLKALVKGDLRRFVGSRELKVQHREYQLSFNYQLGRVSITSFTGSGDKQNV